MLGNFLRGHILYIPEQQSSPLTVSQRRQSGLEVFAPLGLQYESFRAFQRRCRNRLREFIDIRETDPSMPPEEVDCRICGNPREPVSGLLQILDLILPLERFDESFLRKILSIIDIADNPVDQQEDPAQVLGDKPRLLFMDQFLQWFRRLREFVQSHLPAEPSCDGLRETCHFGDATPSLVTLTIA